MCGITGIFNTNGDPVSKDILRRMTDIISHRGPDGKGFYLNSNLGLGHRRLAIIDLTDLAKQPMESEDHNFVIAYNGEVYNFREIRKTLEDSGYKFRSRSDTEVVLNAYKKWGQGCVKKFNGMFSFAIWDCSRKELFLARDRYGIKPIYYYSDNSTFIFGSEIKSILQHPAIKVKVSISALNEYFSFQNGFSDKTLFENIKILPAASTLTVSSGNSSTPKLNKYWDFRFREDNTIDETQATEELSVLFEKAVNRQLVSDVEVGSYLSGGVDSGSITCIAARQYPNLKTFTAGFDLSSASGLELGFDERAKSEFLSNLYKTEHYETVLKAGDMERVMKDLIWHIEDPRVGQSYPNFYVARLASKFVKVVFSGAGGDELFAGYPWRYYRAVINDDFEHYAEKYYRYWLRLIPDRYKPDFYQKSIYPEIEAEPTIDVFRRVFDYKIDNINTPQEYVNHSLYFESKTFLHGLLVVEDKLSMAHSLETRVPFLDNDLVDFALTIPVRYKLKNLSDIISFNENEPGPKTTRYFEKTNDGKIILRNALSKYVPSTYANGIKQGFSAPDASWYKGESIEYIRKMLFDKDARIYEFLQPEKVQELLNEHFDGKTNRRLLIWSLLNFEWWLRIFYI